MGDFPGGLVAKTLCGPIAGGPVSIPGWGIRSCMPQLSPHAAAKTQCNQINRQVKRKKLFKKHFMGTFLYNKSGNICLRMILPICVIKNMKTK